LYISFDAPDREGYRQIRGVDGFDRVAASVRVLKAVVNPPKIVARCTLQRHNLRLIPEIVDSARTVGFDVISFLGADVSTNAFSRDLHGVINTTEIRPNHEDLIVAESMIDELEKHPDAFIEGGAGKLKRIVQYFRALLGETDFPEIRCNAPWASVVIETTGKIRGCFFQPVIGDFHNINGPSALQFRQNLNVARDPTCRRCVCSKNLSTRDLLRMNAG
jgi:MoaA/NifB/PqqE/SkfB family radical SAM enzyme